MTDYTDKFRVMIVDDTPINLQLLAEVLKHEYDVVFATNGRNALEIAEVNSPDLMLLDIQMPEMNGYQVLEKMKQSRLLHSIPVIFLTAMSQQEDEAVGLKMGAVDYITKPINPDIVKLRVGTHLELKFQRDQLRHQRDVLARQKEELEESINRIKKLEGIISICMYCKKIREEDNSWQQLETYISEHSDALFSHGICPNCFKEQYSKNK